MMVKVTFVSSDGTRREVEIAEGETAREAALFNDVPGIDGACGGVCACAPCHVNVDPAWLDRVGRLVEGAAAAELLQFAAGANEHSRLACQILTVEGVEGLTLHIPETPY